MTAQVGEYALAGALLAAAGAILAAIAALRFGQTGPLKIARGLLAGYTLLLLLASVALLQAFIGNDFSLAYVAGYSERALPTGYKLAAFWAGQEGSLLLWALMLGVFSTLAVMQSRRQPLAQQAVTLAVLAGVCAFFTVIMLFADRANPFAQTQLVPEDGRGLNPLLQDPWMIAHPPVLFLGYAGFTVPFAVMVGALASGRRDNQWVLDIRPWLLLSWLFLGAGIVLGALWAYTVLGWGGYWGWDPVENASLLPWLIATALLHSLVLQQQRGMFKVWNALLIAGSFILCIFGTYLTRSGVVQSVHGFGKSDIATFFVVFLLALVLLTVVLVSWRGRQLRSEQPLESLLSREGAFLAANILLTLMMLTTLLGTIFPALGGLFTDQPISVNANFYNKVVCPMGLAVVALMACGPALTSGKDAPARLVRNLTLPAAGAAGAVVSVLVLGLRNSWALLSVAIIALAVLNILTDLARAVRVRMGGEGENPGPVAAVARLLDANHRRYGGQLAHLGIVMVLAGVIGSSLFNTKATLQLAPGESAAVGPYTFTFQQLQQTRHENYSAAEAQVLMSQSGMPGAAATLLRPEVRHYDKEKDDQPVTKVALESSLIQDVYVTLVGVDDDRSGATLQVIINPLVAWIWLGGIVLSLGGLICLLPPLLPRPSARVQDERATTNVARNPLPDAHPGAANPGRLAARGASNKPAVRKA